MVKTPRPYGKTEVFTRRQAVDSEKKLRYGFGKEGGNIKQTESIMTVNSFDIKAILFDFDGTLTEPGALDFSIIKSKIGCPVEMPVLEYIQSIKNSDDRNHALCALNRFESDGARHAMPNLDAEWVVRYLTAKNIPIGIISRNRLKSILMSLENFETVTPADFTVILSRDDSVSPKPSPEGIFYAVKKLGVPVEKTAVVGDFIFDIEAGRAAGAFTVFLDNGRPAHPLPVTSDMRISRLRELKNLVQNEY